MPKSKEFQRVRKLAPYIEPPRRRARGTCRHAPQITLQSTNPYKATLVTEERRGKLGSDAVAVLKPQEKVHTTPASKPNGTSTCVQLHASDEGAVKVSAVPPDLLSKLRLIGSVEVLRDLKYTLFRLRSHPSQSSLIRSHGTGTPRTSGSHDTLRSIQTAQILSMLRNELEVTGIGEQLYRSRKRFALSQFFDFYEFAQKNPLFFLQEGSETIQDSSRNVTSKQALRLNSRVLNRIAILMFPNTAHTDEDAATAGEKSDGCTRKRREQRLSRKSKIGGGMGSLGLL